MTQINDTTRSNISGKNDLFILCGLSLIIFLYQMFTSAFSGYGYFIDEFYYIACSKRLAFGYVDHPPLSIFVLALNRWLFGDSIPSLRFLPALAASATVFMTGLMARRLGGTRVSIVIAALAAIAMPVSMLMGSFYSMNAFEPLIWSIILYFIIKLVQEENPKYFLAIGLLMGIGLEIKHTMVLYGMALIIGMVLTTTRRFLWNRWVLYGIVGCFLLLAPNLIWQYLHEFPSLEFYRNAMVYKNIPTGPLKVVFTQILFTNPLAFPLWIIGLIYCLFSGEGKKYRFLGMAYLFLLIVMVLSQSSRPDRISAMYTFLFASGAVAVEKFRPPAVKRLVIMLMLILLIGGGMVFAPIFSPLLSPQITTKYVSAFGLSFSVEKGKTEPLPQWIADRLGWRDLASEVARVYHSLSPEEQRNSIIVSSNYGEAGALELYGPGFGLPQVFATHNNYHLWGPPSDSFKTYIAVLVERDDLENNFDSVTDAGLQTCEYCTRPQRRIPIYLARGPRFSITKEWPKFKHYD